MIDLRQRVLFWVTALLSALVVTFASLKLLHFVQNDYRLLLEVYSDDQFKLWLIAALVLLDVTLLILSLSTLVQLARSRQIPVLLFCHMGVMLAVNLTAVLVIKEVFFIRNYQTNLDSDSVYQGLFTLLVITVVIWLVSTKANKIQSVDT